MHSIGDLCGLLPGLEPSSEQLNMVVELIAGLGVHEGVYVVVVDRGRAHVQSTQVICPSVN